MSALVDIPKFAPFLVVSLWLTLTVACVDLLYLRAVQDANENSCVFGGYDPDSVPLSRRATPEARALGRMTFADSRFANLAEIVALQYLKKGEIDLYLLYKRDAVLSMEETKADALLIAEKTAHLAILIKKFQGLEYSLDDREKALALVATCAGKKKYNNKISKNRMQIIWNELHSPQEQAKSGEDAWYLFQGGKAP